MQIVAQPLVSRMQLSRPALALAVIAVVLAGYDTYELFGMLSWILQSMTPGYDVGEMEGVWLVDIVLTHLPFLPVYILLLIYLARSYWKGNSRSVICASMSLVVCSFLYNGIIFIRTGELPFLLGGGWLFPWVE